MRESRSRTKAVTNSRAHIVLFNVNTINSHYVINHSFGLHCKKMRNIRVFMCLAVQIAVSEKNRTFLLTICLSLTQPKGLNELLMYSRVNLTPPAASIIRFKKTIKEANKLFNITHINARSSVKTLKSNK